MMHIDMKIIYVEIFLHKYKNKKFILLHATTVRNQVCCKSVEA